MTDGIFTRIGASDDLYGGQSTFMVEMSEMADHPEIRHAEDQPADSGRGRARHVDVRRAVASPGRRWNILRATKCGARKTMFATHYHELSELEGQLDGRGELPHHGAGNGR